MSSISEILAHPASIVIITALLGIFTYSYQSFKNRQAVEYERKRKLYETLIQDVFKLLRVAPGQEASAVMSDIEKSWLFASDDVLRFCYQIIKVYGRAAKEGDPTQGIMQNPVARKDFADGIARLFVAMRKDLVYRQSSKIDEPWALEVIEIYEWGAPYRENQDEKA